MEIAVTHSALACFFFLLYAWGRRRDPRMIRNGVFLTIGVGVCILLGLTLLARVESVAWPVVVTMFVVTPIALVILSIALIANGVVMLRYEGRRLGNLLSLFAGLLMLVLPILLWVLFGWSRIPYPLSIYAVALGVLITLLATYFSVAFVSFAVYSVVYGRMSRKLHPSAIVVLGSGLINGAVPPLLRSRLDRALEIYRLGADRDARPILVPSGGQGGDESRPEGQAMAEYLVEHGADPDDVYPEEKSRNTWENIRFSTSIISNAGRMQDCVVVTNNYHVLRAASLTRRAGIEAAVVGAPTARYFIPSAFIREFVAIVEQHRWLNCIACLPLVVVTVLALWESLQQR
ncbi:YdcF family protein [Rothia uropygialis]|uniref:YdcF family protein n=1 Tax=Kocuria sp. 36 TaxID=1415402 RepID=UPI00101BC85C|nr:YdcF family protein [Kocuria sp. 36]